MRTPDAPLPTDMSTPGVEQKLRIRALRFSWIKDVIQTAAFTAAGIWAIYTFWYRERYLPQVSDTDVTVRLVVEPLSERDGVVAVRARTVLENPGEVPARLLAMVVRPRGRLEGETLLFVRRGEYSVLSVEAQLAWLPAGHLLRKECYTLVRDEEGVVSVGIPDVVTRCRLSTSVASTGIALR